MSRVSFVRVVRALRARHFTTSSHQRYSELPAQEEFDCNPTGRRINKCAALLLRDVEMKYKRKGRYVFTSSQVEELVVVMVVVVVVSSDLSYPLGGRRYLFPFPGRNVPGWSSIPTHTIQLIGFND